MPKLKILEVIFDLPLKPYEIPAFRGAIIELVGREKVAFHNHIGDDKFHYKYPAIQYKSRRNKASVFCIEDGVEELYALFQKKGNQIRLGEKLYSLNIDNVNLSNPFIQVWDKWFDYKIINWLPLNNNHLKVFLEKESEIDKQDMLESILKGNILSFGKGINWRIDKEIKIRIESVDNEKIIKYKPLTDRPLKEGLRRCVVTG